ncbi:fused DNA polymerase IV/DNA polymerase III subunit alpha [Verrucomicrobia bacterium LW23]|nr:fused DNA polymerase IV/DNA polymerase III subunit alpha [Verrucomicrobia bacterium LW23]
MIVHLDADAFFASVEAAANPKLRGKAIAVGGTKRGIIASASYEARRFGVYTPMPTARALKLCPKLIVLPGDFEKYELFSRRMFTYVYDFTPTVEVQGVDEGYFCVRGSKHDPESIAVTVRKAIRESLKITVSEGVGSNKLVSQIASKFKKPDNLIHVREGREKDFLAPLANTWLPGIGPKVSQGLNAAGLSLIGQIALTKPDQLALIMGNMAPQLWQFSQGIDDRPVVPEAPAAKSYGSQETFVIDQTDETYVIAKLRSIADKLMAKVRSDGKMVRTVSVRVRYNDMEEEGRSQSLDEPTSYEADIYALLAVLLRKAWSRRVSLRLVSVKLSGVYDALFDDELDGVCSTMGQGRKLDLSAAVDSIRGEFGNRSIMRGHDLWLRQQEAKADGRPIKTTEKAAAPISTLASPRKSEALTAILNFKSYYSFLDSLLSPKDIVALAKKHNLSAIAVTDPNLHGAVEICQAAEKAGIRAIIAAELLPVDAPAVNAYVEDAEGYCNLCALLSTEKLTQDRLRAHGKGLVFVPVCDCGPEVRYPEREDIRFYNIVQSIRTLTLLHDKHPEKRNGRFHFRGELGMESSTLHQVLERCRFKFEWGGLKFPHYKPADNSTPNQFLRHLTLEGVERRYGKKPDLIDRVRSQVEEELSIIAEVGYDEYFLLCWDILEDCKRMGIDWITRGSAADSLVCYCLGISDVCPVRFSLYFKRFLNRDRMALRKLPDIDIDFPHDRRDEVVEAILAKYGPHAAIVGGFNTYQGRSSFGDIAKVLGVSESQIRRLTQRIPRTSATDVAQAVAESVECGDSIFGEDPYKTALELAFRLDGYPRHPKMHPCGVVLSRDPIHSLTPTFISGKGWPTTHLNMDSVEDVGLVKMDILAQAGLAVMRDTTRILESKGIHTDLKSLEPWENEEIWRMIAQGGCRGVHHIESPAMLSLSKMCGVRRIDDLIAIVSVIRPGGANGLKKTQFARRCQGLEQPDYTHPSLEKVLASTYGVVAYEEHVLEICEAFADMPPGRSDMLRRALVKVQIDKIEEMLREFVDYARKAGRSESEIKTVGDLLVGFRGYAFCRAHSTAYGIEAFQAASLKLNHPKEFLCNVLEHGKGFYSRLVYSIECRSLGIGFLHPDINNSWDRFYPEVQGIRVPVKQVKGLTEASLERITEARSEHPFESIEDFCTRVKPQDDEMQSMIRVGCFDSLDPSRTSQYWAWRRCAAFKTESLYQSLLPLGFHDEAPAVRSEPEHLNRLRAEMEILGFTVSGHPLEQFPEIAWESYCPIVEIGSFPGQTVTVAGLIIEDRLHHQVDGRTMKFISICDPTGIAEVEIFADAYERSGINTVRYPIVEIRGIVNSYESGIGNSLDATVINQPRGLTAS